MAKRPTNKEVTSDKAAKSASKVLINKKSTKDEKAVAGSALTQKPNKAKPAKKK